LSSNRTTKVLAADLGDRALDALARVDQQVGGALGALDFDELALALERAHERGQREQQRADAGCRSRSA
jgi:hypothetical protein